jgi:integrase/recombinase XerC
MSGMQNSYLDHFLNYLEKEKRVSPETLRGYSDDIQYFINYLDNQNLSLIWESIETDTIRNWVVYLANEGKKPTVIRRRIAGLNAMYRFLQRSGRVNKNPVKRIPLPKVPKRLPRFVTVEGMKKLSSSHYFSADFSGIRDRLIIEILYGTGMRRAEISNLRDMDIHWDRKEIKVMGKGRKMRIIPVNPSLFNLMEEYVKERNALFEERAETFLTTNKGKKVYTRFIYEVSTRYLRFATSIENKGPHLIRHTFATHLMDNGADIQSLKALLGHSNLAATQVYMHNSAERLKKIYQQAHPKANRKLP